MRFRHLTLSLLALTGACSQRSPWRVVGPAPMPASAALAGGDALALAAAAAAPDATSVAHMNALVFPVAGQDSARLDDSFDAPRDGGARRHNAIDIMAPRGTPVLSVADGHILRLANTAKGGISIYATDLENQFVYYYAHLDRYHSRIYSGKPLLRGDTLGFVGTTGNAPDNLPHLHFQLMRMPASGNYINGEPINPYPLLRATISSVSLSR